MTTGARYFIGTLLAVASLVVVPVPGYPLDDVLGWESIIWGMTESEVTKSVEAHGFHLVPGWTPLGGPLARNIPFQTNIEIDGNRYNVAFLFSDRTRRLSGVLIGAVDDSREHALKLHGSLLRTLTARYGPPSDAESRGSLTSATSWAFKTTTVALRLDTDAGVRGHRVTHVSVVYSPTVGSDQRQAKEKFLVLALLKSLGQGWRP